MTRILSKNVLLAAILLLALAGYVGLFEVRSGAAKPHQAPPPAAGSTRNSNSAANSLTRLNSTSDGEVQIIVTSYQGGQISSRIIATVANPTEITADASSAADPMQTAAAGDIVFSQIYGSGGNPGSTFQNNYIELFNRTNNVIDFGGWPIYITTATGTFNQSIAFVSSRGIAIGAHRYVLIRFGPDSTNGAPLPNPDFVVPFSSPIPGIPPTNLSPSGKVFLAAPGTGLIGSTCPLPNSSIVDFVGYGSTANCFEGTGPAAATDNTTAALRKSGGFTDTENNANDFLAGTPNPRNSFSAENNPIDDAEFFVRQHYSDFLNRQPDPSGLAFWIDQITSCSTDQTCVEIRRINVSAAFFLSIEFRETGYLVERLYKTSYGDSMGTSTIGGTPHQLVVPIIRFNEFLPDAQLIGQGVIVGQPGWEQVLENNKQIFIDQFVQRSRFTTAFPLSMTALQFVDALNANAGGVLSQVEHDQLVNELATNAKTRAQVLRAIAEDADLDNAEKNRAFVLMQYFGYLRRNPNDPPDLDYSGYDFWLTKLNQFNGNFVNAEMVKAFILSAEYRQRF